MLLDENTNYIVSGLERSGTSMLMQILHAGGLETSFDDSRKPDTNNPKGYFELEGGKIINKLMDNTFPFDEHKGKFIKITAYGLKFLPAGKYRIIYSERNIEEILDSMAKMAKLEDENREDTKKVFIGLNNVVKDELVNRDDVDLLLVSYNDIIHDPRGNIINICSFLGLPEGYVSKMMSAVDEKLYRQRKT